MAATAPCICTATTVWAIWWAVRSLQTIPWSCGLNHSYDSANRATRIIRQDADNDTYECRWEYDHNNNVTNLVEIVNGQTHTSAYTYDLEQRISQFVNDGVTSGYTYDGFGRLSSASNGILSRNYGYKVTEDGFATGQVAALTLDAANYDRTYTYTYDANGNILSVSDGTNTTSYVYDSLNQLVRENNQAAGKTWVYTYDNGGNILSKQEYGYSTGDLDPNDAFVKNYTYGDTHWGDLLTAYNGVTITHDEIGNPLNDGTWTYTWENGRQLAAMESDTAEWTFKYNADGLRTERSNGTVTYDYIYSGSQLIQMTVGNDTLYFTYDASGMPMAVDFNGTKYFYATNLQGDIIAILDTDGHAVVEYTYDAWGNHLSTTGTMANTLGAVNPLRYRGYIFDQETQLYYLQSRYYDPEIGRFINADAYASTGQGVLGNNMFVYCLNNPVALRDSSGTLATDADLYPNQQAGEYFAKWLLGIEDEDDDLSDEEKIGRTYLAILYNFEFSAGLGVGVEKTFTIFDLGGSVGGHYDIICIQYCDGEFECGQNIYFGIVFSAGQPYEVGAEIDLFIQNGVAEDPTHWILINNTQESWTLFEYSSYPIFLGGNIRIGFDLNTFLSDMDNIWETRK